MSALMLPLLLAGAEPDWAARLQAGYPEHVASVSADEVVLRDGTRLAVSDGKAKTAETRINDPDFDDMFAQAYRPGKPSAKPRTDPGRARYEPFFDRVYGDCRKGEVEPKLREVAWMPSRGGGGFKVNAANGAADALARVVAELETLPAAMTRYLVPAAGTYNCRVIAGTTQRSMHAYGVAIDINVEQSDYWRWSGMEAAPYRNRIPWKIVAIFERHGFIWGGKWRHFDTMHFEYRPELLPPSR